MQLLKQILSTQLSGRICLLIAIIAKLVVQVAEFGFGGDKSYQLVAAKNLLAGKGISMGQVLLNDISVMEYEPLVGWPPGYSVAIAPFLWLFDGDYKVAALVLDVLCLIPFFYFLVKLSDLLMSGRWLRNLFILFAGLFIYPATSKLGTDLLAFSCLLGAFYYVLQLMERSKRRYVLLSAIFLFLTGLFRYNYIPVSIAIPFCLLLAGFINKKREWKINALYFGSLLLLLFSILLLFQYYYTGAATYIKKTDTGFYEEHLLNMYPVVPASLFDIETWLSFFSNATGTNFINNRRIACDISFILFLLLLIYTLWWFSAKRFKLYDRFDHAAFTGTAISLSIIAMLSFFAARNAMLYWSSGEPWTYLLEHRYFVFVCFFIQLIIFIGLFARYEALNRFWKTIAIVCTTLMIINSIHKAYYIFKLSFSETKEISSGINPGTDSDFLLSQYKKVKEIYPGQEIVVASPKKVICNYAALENIKSTYTIEPNLFNQIKTKTAAKILLVLHRTHIDSYRLVLNGPMTKYIDQTGDWHFYLVSVEPAS